LHVILRRALFFLLPLLIISALLTLFVHSVSELPKKPLKLSKQPSANLDTKSKKNSKSKNLSSSDTVSKSDAQIKSLNLSNNSDMLSEETPTHFQPVIVLDPAHGGSDLGSLSERGVTEANINLVFSFKLARALRMRGFKVFLTRMDDTNPSLEQRFKEAETHKPIIYLSINCGYSHNKRISGLEVYGFTPEPQHTEIEKIKNDFYEFHEGIYESKNEDALVLENKVSSVIKEDMDLAYKSRLLRRKFKTLALASNTPALAIFVGYLSNDKEAKKLSNPKYTDELAEKLAKAIEEGITRKL
jgi:N-acetylmuramoyl-L-alanine amidase